MELRAARKILGLGPDEDPRLHLREFRAARERIADLVRNAPNETLGDRYQIGLMEFDQALAAVREHLRSLGLTDDPPEHEIPEGLPVPDPDDLEIVSRLEATIRLEQMAPPAKPASSVKLVEAKPAAKPKRALSRAVAVFTILILATAAAIFYIKNQEWQHLRNTERITLLESLGSKYIENRRWQDATEAYQEIAGLDPDSELPKIGLRSIEAGMAEEQRQFVGYWTGQAIADLDTDRIDQAETAINKIRDRFPREPELPALQARLDQAREKQAYASAIAGAKKLLDEQLWQQALTAAESLRASHPDDPAVGTIITRARAGLARIEADHKRANELLAFAISRDRGVFDEEALNALREAATLFPENTEIATRYETMASYSRTLRVPEDFPTPADAIEAARPRDRIVLAAQTWKGPVTIAKPLNLQGAGSGKTIIECPATEASALTIGPEAAGTRVSGITFRHESFHAQGADRYSAALVRGGSATFLDCHFTGASGHGLAVIEKGQVIANRCRFASNGWNGAAAIGRKSFLEIRESEALANFEHGIESWQGAAVILANNLCSGNSRNGIHADNLTAEASIENNQLLENREFGLVLDSAGSGRVTGNTASGNLLGGIVIRTAAAAVTVRSNTATRNNGPGLVLERGLVPDDYTTNTAVDNKSREVLVNADLGQRDTTTAE